MRVIGQLPDEASARVFSDFLAVEGIPNQVEPGEQSQWTVWVQEDDHRARAGELLEEFRREPTGLKYRKAAPVARELRQQEKAERTAWARRFFDRRSLWHGLSWRVGGLTALLVAGCVVVAAFKLLRGEHDPVVGSLYITGFTIEGDMISYLKGLPEIHSGQVWRLVTPIFLHFGMPHLLFNMLWLLDLASLIEARCGARRLAALVVLIAAASNLAQYAMAGPSFGGMSGVVYGLFGYIWLRGKLDPRCGLFINPTNVTLMVVWFFVCMTGWVGPIANTAHAVGLATGLLWGFLAAQLNRGG